MTTFRLWAGPDDGYEFEPEQGRTEVKMPIPAERRLSPGMQLMPQPCSIYRWNRETGRFEYEGRGTV